MTYYFIKQFLISLIKVYQKTISFDHGILSVFYPHGFCRYRPTCSQYAIDAIEKHGIVKGGVMAAWRILRCNPWSCGGHDPVK